MPTRATFQQTADILRAEIDTQRKIGSDECANVITLIARAFANTYARENPKFDRAKFMRACGI